MDSTALSSPIGALSLGHDREEKKRTEDVVVTGVDAQIDFHGLKISPIIVSGLSACGFRKPSPIELEAIPLGKAGHDLLVQAKSGTGKTCVFTVIALETVDVSQKHIQVVIVNPAREIAIQSSAVVTEIGSCIEGLLVKTFIGGVPLSENILNAGECHVAVGTPGRMVQLLREGYLDLSKAPLLILDEADKLTDATFFDDVHEIVKRMTGRKQLLAVSATYPSDLDAFIVKFMRHPQKVQLDVEKPALIGVSQVLFDVQKVLEDKRRLTRDEEVVAKYKCLLKILKHIDFTQAMIFCQYQLRASQIYEDLCKENKDVQLLSGRMTQKDRTNSYNCLRWGTKKIIVCTDLCARGLDSQFLDLVINFELPPDLATYQHRVGRAGRFGSFGMTINLIAQRFEMERLQLFQNELKVDLPVIDSIETLVGLGKNVEQLKVLRHSLYTVSGSGSGINQDYLKFCLFGSKEEKEANEVERLTLYSASKKDPSKHENLIASKLALVQDLVEKIKLQRIRKAERQAAKKLKQAEQSDSDFSSSDKESSSDDLSDITSDSD